MLRGLRKASSNWLGKTIMATVMGVLIVSFGIWGIADIFRGFGQSTLATIGRTEISAEQFRQLYNDKLQQLGRQLRRPLTSEQARAVGFDRQLLQQTISEAVLDEQARRLGLGQSDAQTMRTIFNDPNFKGVNGTFDPNRFQAMIRQAGFTEPRYLADQRKVSLRNQIVSTLVAGVEPSKLLIEALSRFQNETRAVEYVRLDAAQAGTIEPPSPEILASYFEAHKFQFKAPEYRKIAFAVVTPDDLAKVSDVSDDDAKKLFEQRRDQMGTPEKRQVSQIVFPNLAEATAARDRISAGLSFEDLAKERGLQPADVDLGTVAKSGILDSAVADAAFSATVGEVSQPVQGKFGIALVKVGKIEPGAQPNYDSVAASLKKEIAVDRARAAMSDLHNKMEDERGGGAGVTEAAKKLGLSVQTIDAIDRSGRLPDGQPAANIPQGLDLASQAFASDVGVENDPVQINGGYLWFDVLGITPAHDRNLNEVKDQVEAKWREDQIATRLQAKADEMVKKLDQGGKLSDEATAAGLKAETATGLKRDSSLPNLPASLVPAAFRTAKDSAGQTPGNGGSEWLVFKVTEVTTPPVDMGSPDITALKTNLQRAITDEEVGQYVAKLQNEIGVTINQSAFAQATGAGS